MYDPKEYARNYRATHKEMYRKSTRDWYYKRKAEGRVRIYSKEKQALYLRNLRKSLLEAYGGKCTCCGETEPMFLELDHINNNGAEDRKVLPGNRLYFWLRRNNFPPGFQVLCANCNRGKYRNGGVCPHKAN